MPRPSIRPDDVESVFEASARGVDRQYRLGIRVAEDRAFALAARDVQVIKPKEAEQRIAPMLLSFMNESRRLSNTRMTRELRVRLKYPTPAAMLAAVAPRALRKQLALPI